MMALWVGGLAQFLVAIPLVRRLGQPVAPTVGRLVVNFSNCARVAVIALVITGLYATWNLVTTWDGLTTTLYGQLLTLKLFLALALLVVGAINLLWTPRGLMTGQSIWVWRLRILIISEVVLLCAILVVVGAMTSINPARSEIAQRQAAAPAPPAPQQESMLMMNTEADDLQIQFMVAPGWVGDNNFTVALKDKAGNPITDARLIRLRFTNETQKSAESELQIHPQGETKDGLYTIDGANVSSVGDWRVRMTIQRPKQYDTVTDVKFKAVPAPPPPPLPVVEENPVLPYRTPVLLATGILALLAGLYSVIEQRKQLWQGATWMATLLVMMGVAFLLAGLIT
jgi:copper transport protein